ncbi:MAG: hypothetical protein R2942_10425 [Ignavibacteria bacterium]
MVEKGLYDRKGNEFVNYSEYRTILNYAVRPKLTGWRCVLTGLKINTKSL